VGIFAGVRVVGSLDVAEELDNLSIGTIFFVFR